MKNRTKALAYVAAGLAVAALAYPLVPQRKVVVCQTVVSMTETNFANGNSVLVVTGKDAEDLKTWLEKNGFPLPAESYVVIERRNGSAVVKTFEPDGRVCTGLSVGVSNVLWKSFKTRGGIAI